MGTIFTAVLLLFVAVSVLWSVFVRKLVKTRIKSIFVIASVVLALIGTVAVKNFVLDPAFAQDTLLPMVASDLPAMVGDLVTSSAALREVALGLPVALISPMIFVLLYIVLYVLTSIIYLLVLLFAGRKLRKSKKNKAPYAKARGFVWSA